METITEGMKLVADDGFSCIAPGAVVTVERDSFGKLFVRCDCGEHYLDGQFKENGELLGLSKVAT